MGGSRVQIGGPTGAFVVLIAGIVAKYGTSGLAVATVLAGIVMIIFSLARLGEVIRFIPYPVTIGFTSGIALIIAIGQIGDALGISVGPGSAHTIDKVMAYGRHMATVDPKSVAIFLITVVVIQLWSRFSSRLPGPLIAIVLTTIIVQVFGFEIDTIHSRFGDVPRGLPSFQWVSLDWHLAPQLVSSAISIALLGSVESLLSALVADGLTGGRHRSNVELMAQGVANIASPFFGGIPATGAIARTATNVRNGGRTPIAGIVHAVVLLLILLVAAPWAALIPMASLAGVLMIVAYNMSEWHVFVKLLRGPRSDVLVLVSTFVLTVAIQFGVVLAALLFMRRMAEVTQITSVRDASTRRYEDEEESQLPDLPSHLEVFEINGSFCFGAARKFTETVLAIRSAPAVVILRMRHVLAMDATGMHALEDVAARLQKRGTRLLLSGVQAQPLLALERSGTIDRIGRENVF
ncbi:MAG: SulP family inorganic anion transporter, partial [Verrucomicrobia bacterium]|nr:SulP family inorganic anion transporter [Verrucomicrobiota bacterium]